MYYSPGQRLSAQVRQWGRTVRTVVNKLPINEQEATKYFICFCVLGKDQSLTAATFEVDVRMLPFLAIKPRYSVCRLAQKHLTILMNNLLLRKVVKTCRM